jgi:hypothetical protein
MYSPCSRHSLILYIETTLFVRQLIYLKNCREQSSSGINSRMRIKSLSWSNIVHMKKMPDKKSRKLQVTNNPLLLSTFKTMHNQKSTWHYGGYKFCRTWLRRQMWDAGGLFILLNHHHDVSPCSMYPLWCILHPNVQQLSWTLHSWQNIIIFIEAKSEIQEGGQEKLFSFALVRVFLSILKLPFHDQLFMVFAK